MAQDTYLFNVCEYSRSKYEYKYEYIASKYKYLKFVLEYKYKYQVLQLWYTVMMQWSAVQHSCEVRWCRLNIEVRLCACIATKAHIHCISPIHI